MKIDSEGAIIRAMREELPLSKAECPHRRQTFSRETESFNCVNCGEAINKLGEVIPRKET